MTTAKTIHKECLDAWNKRDWTKFESMLHKDYRYTGGDGKETVGVDAGVELARGWATAFPDGKTEITKVWVDGDTSVAEFTAKGTHKGNLMGIAATNKPVNFRVCSVVELRDGKIYREREYIDMLNLMEQIGVVKSPIARAKTA